MFDFTTPLPVIQNYTYSGYRVDWVTACNWLRVSFRIPIFTRQSVVLVYTVCKHESKIKEEIMFVYLLS